MKSNTMNPPAFAYLRVSKEDGENGNGKQGLADQRKIIEDAFSKKYDVVRWFEDVEVSRKTYFDERPAGKRLLAMLLDGGVDTVLVANSDRLGLLKESQTFLGQCSRNGVKVLTPDGIDQTTDYIQSGINGIVSEKSYHDLVERLQTARNRRRAEGKRVAGRWPYGWHPNHAFDNERKVLKMMLDMHAKGMSAYAIKEWLNKHDFKTRLGGPWFEPSVSRSLKRGLPPENK